MSLDSGKGGAEGAHRMDYTITTTFIHSTLLTVAGIPRLYGTGFAMDLPSFSMAMTVRTYSFFVVVPILEH